MPFIESFDEFAQRMGCEYEWVENRYLFANGAESTGELGQHAEPPDYKWDRLLLRREFLQFRLDREIRRWHEFQQACLAQASAYRQSGGNVPPPPHDADEQLERGRERIEALTEQIEVLNKQYKDSPEAQEAERETRQREALKAERNAEVADLIRRVQDKTL